MSSEDIITWRTKILLKRLRDATGNGTSMVTIILRPGESISKMSQKLTEEHGTASNIQSRVNRQSVESAIVSAQQRLKLYSTCPKNGLAIFSGEVIDENNKGKRLCIDFEPFKPINTTMYMCDNRFHIEPLEELLLDEKVFVFVILNATDYLLATLSGNTRAILDKDSTAPIAKTRRGGQSANRFARLREEAKHEWLRKVSERLKKNLVDTGLIKGAEGVILAGNAHVKDDFQGSALVDKRILEKVIVTVDVSYGGLSGFNHAIELTKNTLRGLKFMQERAALQAYFDLIATDGNVAFGIQDTMTALELGAVETLLVWDELETERRVYRVEDSETPEVLYEEPDAPRTETRTLLTKQQFLEWIVENHTKFGAEVKFVSDSTSEGTQFVKGFGGLGAMLRYKVDFTQYEEED